jgi:hypothetical protein
MHTFVKSACGLYIALGRWEDALPLAKRLEVLKPQAVGAYKLEFQIQRNLGNEAAALDAANRAVANCKDIVLQDFLANIGNAEK